MAILQLVCLDGLLCLPSLDWSLVPIGYADLQLYVATQRTFPVDNGECGVDWVLPLATFPGLSWMSKAPLRMGTTLFSG
jgi:hypothetical protein